MTASRPDWRRLARPGFGVEFSYPAITPRGQTVERDDEPFRDHARVHLSSPDRQELYLEVVRFDDLAPEDEYRHHSPNVERRFGSDSITRLAETILQGRPAWTYAFRWDEGERAMERSALLLRVGRDTYRLIYDPRSQLNADVIATLTIRQSGLGSLPAVQKLQMFRIRNLILLWLGRKAWKIAHGAWRRRSTRRANVRR